MVVAFRWFSSERDADGAGREELFNRDRVVGVPSAASGGARDVVARASLAEVERDSVGRRRPAARQPATMSYIVSFLNYIIHI